MIKNDFLLNEEGTILRKYQGKERIVVIPEGVTTIERLAFHGCKLVKVIEIPDGVTTIMKEAFCNLRDLGEVIFPDSVTYVGADIFEYANPYQITVFGEIFDLDEEDLDDEYDIDPIKDDYDYNELQYTDLFERVRFIVASEIPALLLNGNYDNLYMPESLRWDIIVRALKHKPKHENFLNMVKQDITEIFIFLLKEPDIIRFLIDNEVITSQNIDECIHIAKEHNASEVEELLSK